MLSGNKGEWSEVYVFLKLLADGRLNAADANLNAITNIYYPIIKILRQETTDKKQTFKREYSLNGKGTINITDGETGKALLNIPVSEFVKKSLELFKELKASKGSSSQFSEIEEFLTKINVHSLKALKKDKSDINVVVHDLNNGLKPTLGFSIKSMLGKDSTLFNAGETTNFIYEITPLETEISSIGTLSGKVITNPIPPELIPS